MHPVLAVDPRATIQAGAEPLELATTSPMSSGLSSSSARASSRDASGLGHREMALASSIIANWRSSSILPDATV